MISGVDNIATTSVYFVGGLTSDISMLFLVPSPKSTETWYFSWSVVTFCVPKLKTYSPLVVYLNSLPGAAAKVDPGTIVPPDGMTLSIFA